MDHSFDDPSSKSQPKALVACEYCRKRRIRCDGKFPCQSCLSRERECVFSNEPPKKRGPKTKHQKMELESLIANGKSNTARNSNQYSAGKGSAAVAPVSSFQSVMATVSRINGSKKSQNQKGKPVSPVYSAGKGVPGSSSAITSSSQSRRVSRVDAVDLGNKQVSGVIPNEYEQGVQRGTHVNVTLPSSYDANFQPEHSGSRSRRGIMNHQQSFGSSTYPNTNYNLSGNDLVMKDEAVYLNTHLDDSLLFSAMSPPVKSRGGKGLSKRRRDASPSIDDQPIPFNVSSFPQVDDAVQYPYPGVEMRRPVEDTPIAGGNVSLSTPILHNRRLHHSEFDQLLSASQDDLVSYDESMRKPEGENEVSSFRETIERTWFPEPGPPQPMVPIFPIPDALEWKAIHSYFSTLSPHTPGLATLQDLVRILAFWAQGRSASHLQPPVNEVWWALKGKNYSLEFEPERIGDGVIESMPAGGAGPWAAPLARAAAHESSAPRDTQPDEDMIRLIYDSIASAEGSSEKEKEKAPLSFNVSAWPSYGISPPQPVAPQPVALLERQLMLLPADDKAQLSFYYALLAIGHRIGGNEDSLAAADTCFERSRLLALSTLDAPSHALVSSLLMMAYYSMGMGSMATATLYSSFAWRLGRAVGLSVDDGRLGSACRFFRQTVCYDLDLLPLAPQRIYVDPRIVQTPITEEEEYSLSTEILSATSLAEQYRAQLSAWETVRDEWIASTRVEIEKRNALAVPLKEESFKSKDVDSNASDVPVNTLVAPGKDVSAETPKLDAGTFSSVPAPENESSGETGPEQSLPVGGLPEHQGFYLIAAPPTMDELLPRPVMPPDSLVSQAATLGLPPLPTPPTPPYINPLLPLSLLAHPHPAVSAHYLDMRAHELLGFVSSRLMHQRKGMLTRDEKRQLWALVDELSYLCRIGPLYGLRFDRARKASIFGLKGICTRQSGRNNLALLWCFHAVSVWDSVPLDLTSHSFVSCFIARHVALIILSHEIKVAMDTYLRVSREEFSRRGLGAAPANRTVGRACESNSDSDWSEESLANSSRAGDDSIYETDFGLGPKPEQEADEGYSSSATYKGKKKSNFPGLKKAVAVAGSGRMDSLLRLEQAGEVSAGNTVLNNTETTATESSSLLPAGLASAGGKSAPSNGGNAANISTALAYPNSIGALSDLDDLANFSDFSVSAMSVLRSPSPAPQNPPAAAALLSKKRSNLPLEPVRVDAEAIASNPNAERRAKELGPPIGRAYRPAPPLEQDVDVEMDAGAEDDQKHESRKESGDVRPQRNRADSNASSDAGSGYASDAESDSGDERVKEVDNKNGDESDTSTSTYYTDSGSESSGSFSSYSSHDSCSTCAERRGGERDSRHFLAAVAAQEAVSGLHPSQEKSSRSSRKSREKRRKTALPRLPALSEYPFFFPCAFLLKTVGQRWPCAAGMYDGLIAEAKALLVAASLEVKDAVKLMEKEYKKVRVVNKSSATVCSSTTSGNPNGNAMTGDKAVLLTSADIPSISPSVELSPALGRLSSTSASSVTNNSGPAASSQATPLPPVLATVPKHHHHHHHHHHSHRHHNSHGHMRKPSSLRHVFVPERDPSSQSASNSREISQPSASHSHPDGHFMTLAVLSSEAADPNEPVGPEDAQAAGRTRSMMLHPLKRQHFEPLRFPNSKGESDVPSSLSSTEGSPIALLGEPRAGAAMGNNVGVGTSHGRRMGRDDPNVSEFPPSASARAPEAVGSSAAASMAAASILMAPPPLPKPITPHSGDDTGIKHVDSLLNAAEHSTAVKLGRSVVNNMASSTSNGGESITIIAAGVSSENHGTTQFPRDSSSRLTSSTQLPTKSVAGGNALQHATATVQNTLKTENVNLLDLLCSVIRDQKPLGNISSDLSASPLGRLSLKTPHSSIGMSRSMGMTMGMGKTRGSDSAAYSVSSGSSGSLTHMSQPRSFLVDAQTSDNLDGSHTRSGASESVPSSLSSPTGSNGTHTSAQRSQVPVAHVDNLNPFYSNSVPTEPGSGFNHASIPSHSQSSLKDGKGHREELAEALALADAASRAAPQMAKGYGNDESSGGSSSASFQKKKAPKDSALGRLPENILSVHFRPVPQPVLHHIADLQSVYAAQGTHPSLTLRNSHEPFSPPAVKEKEILNRRAPVRASSISSVRGNGVSAYGLAGEATSDWKKSNGFQLAPGFQQSNAGFSPSVLSSSSHHSVQQRETSSPVYSHSSSVNPPRNSHSLHSNPPSGLSPAIPSPPRVLAPTSFSIGAGPLPLLPLSGPSALSLPPSGSVMNSTGSLSASISLNSHHAEGEGATSIGMGLGPDSSIAPPSTIPSGVSYHQGKMNSTSPTSGTTFGYLRSREWDSDVPSVVAQGSPEVTGLDSRLEIDNTDGKEAMASSPASTNVKRTVHPDISSIFLESQRRRLRARSMSVDSAAHDSDGGQPVAAQLISNFTQQGLRDSSHFDAPPSPVHSNLYGIITSNAPLSASASPFISDAAASGTSITPLILEEPNF